MVTIPEAGSPRLLLALHPAPVRIAALVGVALVLGGLTSFGQALLPAEFAPVANSAAGWSVPTAILVLVSARGYPEAAIGAALAFVSLTVGYALVSGWRGFPYDPTEWAVVGLVAGPVIGCAAHALRRGRYQAALGAGVLAGSLIGEGVYGLTVVAETTSPVSWWVAIAMGAALAVGTSIRLRAPLPALVPLLVAAVTATAFLLAYSALPLLFLAVSGT